MTSNFSINRIFEENMLINFSIDAGLFTTNGQTFVIQHFPAIQNLSTLTKWDHAVTGEDANNYLTVEYRWSFDTLTWTPWIVMPNDFNNFLNPNTNQNIWLQVKYTFVSDLTKQVKLTELNIDGVRTVAEIFQPVTIPAGNSVVYTNQDTYKVFSLQDFKIFLSSGNLSDLVVNFRFTQTQGRIWSPWTPLTTENLQVTKVERLKFCNFQFAFQNNGPGPMGIYDLELIGEFQNITANYKTMSKMGLKTQCNPLAVKPAPTGPCDDTKITSAGSVECDTCIASSESLTPWNANISECSVCNDSNFVQINDRKLWGSQINLYSQLNDFISKTNSWKCTYLLTDPDGKGIDHILHEQQIHNVVAMKDINIMIPDNQFPVDNMNFAGLDLDLIQSFEIHILKDTFKQAFGVEFRPGRRDIAYLCDINQLWEVEQMFPKRGFMNAEVYYRVLMKKYNQKASRQFAKTADGQNAKNFVTELTKYTTLDDLFGINENSDIKQNTKNINNKTIENPSQQYTATSLLTIRKAMNSAIIKKEEFWNASLTVAKSVYQMPIKSKGIKLVEYNTTDRAVGKADNRAFSFWLKTEDYNPIWDWTLLSNYDYTASKGYKISIFQGALTFVFNGNSWQIPLQGFNKDVWYCFLINVDQVQQKLELSVYNRQSELGETLTNSQLVLFNKMIFDIAPDEFTHEQEIFVGGIDTFSNSGNKKNWYLTNIRIYNQVIDKTARHVVLNENVVTDAQLTILVDNAEKVLVLPKYGNL
jgi:hypothetical protein